jgi:hypothetical protein
MLAQSSRPGIMRSEPNSPLHRNFPANRCELQQEIKLCLYVQLQQL